MRRSGRHGGEGSSDGSSDGAGGAAGRTVDRRTLGAWVLKCNPSVWDLRGLLDAGERRLTSWAVHPSYRTQLVRPGDRVLFWVSGPGHDRLTRGIWGLGHTV